MAPEGDGRDPGARLLAKLRAEENALLARKRRRLAARHGDPVPKVIGVVNSVRDRVRDRWQAHLGVRGLHELAQEQSVYLICAELENVIWARVRPGTSAAVERLEQKIRRLIVEEGKRIGAEQEGARRKRVEEEEARLRAEAEVEARLRSEADERARRVRAKYGSPKPYDEMAGMRPFDFEAYERQAAAAKHPPG